MFLIGVCSIQTCADSNYKRKDATIIRQLASKEHRYAVNAMWAHPELRRELLTKVRGEIENECQSLCSNRNPSLFRRSSPQGLISFSENKCETEFKEKAPVGCNYLQRNKKKNGFRTKTVQHFISNNYGCFCSSIEEMFTNVCPGISLFCWSYVA